MKVNCENASIMLILLFGLHLIITVKPVFVLGILSVINLCNLLYSSVFNTANFNPEYNHVNLIVLVLDMLLSWK